MHIVNLVGVARAGKKNAERLDLEKLHHALDRLISAGMHGDLKGAIKDPYSVEYDPKKFAAVLIKLSKPRAAIKVFRKWVITCTGCDTEEDMASAIKTTVKLIKLALAPEVLPIKEDNLFIKISNITLSADIGRPIGCGILQKAFPDKEVVVSKFAGGSYDIQFTHGKMMVFSGGRLTAMGFKDIDLAQKTILDAVRAINEALDMHGEEDRSELCKIERFEPANAPIKEYAAALNLLDEVREKAVEFIRLYCQKVAKGSFGGSPESFAAAAIYLAGVFYNKRLTQKKICDTIKITPASLNRARDKIILALELDIIR